MSKNQSKLSGRTKKKAEVSLIRSSAAEYLSFVASSGDSEASIEMRYENENIWLTQKMMATLYDVSVPTINQHLKRLFNDNELELEATIKKYLIVQTEGSREVQRSATALDYDPSVTATKRFFAAVQNKMHYAVHGQTAAEVIVNHALKSLNQQSNCRYLNLPICH